MTKLSKMCIDATTYCYDVNVREAAELGAKKIRQEIYNLVKCMDEVNSENLKTNPELASFLLLELAEKIKTFGDEIYEV